jgi:hypothetical protein
MHCRFTPTCFSKSLPPSGGGSYLRSYSSNLYCGCIWITAGPEWSVVEGCNQVCTDRYTVSPYSLGTGHCSVKSRLNPLVFPEMKHGNGQIRYYSLILFPVCTDRVKPTPY